MKKTPAVKMPRKPSSFTLVELLVVIAIIAILAATLLRIGGMVINSAKRTKAANTATQLQTASLSYYTEYGVYPVPNSTPGDYAITDVASGAAAWGNLACALCGGIHPYSPTTAYTPPSAGPTNNRGIAFLSLKSSDVDSSDAPLNPLPTGTGTTQQMYFDIAFDSDYSGILGNSGSVSLPNFPSSPVTGFSAPSGGTSTAGVAVWGNCNGSVTTGNSAFWVHTY